MRGRQGAIVGGIIIGFLSDGVGDFLQTNEFLLKADSTKSNKNMLAIAVMVIAGWALGMISQRSLVIVLVSAGVSAAVAGHLTD